MPCERKYPSGRTLVNEFDLFASPNNQGDAGHPSAALHNRAPLGSLHRVHHEIGLELRALSVLDGDCPVTQLGVMTALVLTNPKAGQTLFYQLRLAVLRYRDGATSTKMNGPAWFFAGENLQNGGHGQYGFSDAVAELGAPEAKTGAATTYRFELLPRLVEVIEMGRAKGLDRARALDPERHLSWDERLRARSRAGTLERIRADGGLSATARGPSTPRAGPESCAGP